VFVVRQQEEVLEGKARAVPPPHPTQAELMGFKFLKLEHTCFTRERSELFLRGQKAVNIQQEVIRINRCVIYTVQASSIYL
jgi:hypothetical protein